MTNPSNLISTLTEAKEAVAPTFKLVAGQLELSAFEMDKLEIALMLTHLEGQARGILYARDQYQSPPTRMCTLCRQSVLLGTTAGSRQDPRD